MSWDENPEGYRSTGGPQASTAHGQKEEARPRPCSCWPWPYQIPPGPDGPPHWALLSTHPSCKPSPLDGPRAVIKSALEVTLTHEVLAVDLCLDPWGRCCTRGEEGRKATNTCPLAPVRWGTLPHFLLRVGAGRSPLFGGQEASGTDEAVSRPRV